MSDVVWGPHIYSCHYQQKYAFNNESASQIHNRTGSSKFYFYRQCTLYILNI